MPAFDILVLTHPVSIIMLCITV